MWPACNQNNTSFKFLIQNSHSKLSITYVLLTFITILPLLWLKSKLDLNFIIIVLFNRMLLLTLLVLMLHFLHDNVGRPISSLFKLLLSFFINFESICWGFYLTPRISPSFWLKKWDKSTELRRRRKKVCL